MSMQKILNVIRNFLTNRDGATAIVYSLSLVPVLGTVGFAIDSSRLQSARQTAAMSADATATSTVQALAHRYATGNQMTQGEAEAYATDFLQLGFSNLHTDTNCALQTLAINATHNFVQLTLACELPTTIGALLGADIMRFNTVAAAHQNYRDIEMVMVVDFSKSMVRDGKIDALKAAAMDTIDILLDPNNLGEVRVGLVPYSSSVNLDTYFTLATNEAVDNHTCASERVGINAFTDAAPGTGTYSSVKTGVCPSTPIVPLTDDKSVLTTALNTAVPRGKTAGQIGLAWAYYMLAEPWQGIWPTASQPGNYNAANLTKAALIMTDGAFEDTHNPSLGTPAYQILEICENMRDEGIIVFTVGFDTAFEIGTDDLLEDCAGSSSRHYTADNANELSDAFVSITQDLGQLRLSE